MKALNLHSHALQIMVLSQPREDNIISMEVDVARQVNTTCTCLTFVPAPISQLVTLPAPHWESVFSACVSQHLVMSNSFSNSPLSPADTLCQCLHVQDGLKRERHELKGPLQSKKPRHNRTDSNAAARPSSMLSIDSIQVAVAPAAVAALPSPHHGFSQVLATSPALMALPLAAGSAEAAYASSRPAALQPSQLPSDLREGQVGGPHNPPAAVGTPPALPALRENAPAMTTHGRLPDASTLAHCHITSSGAAAVGSSAAAHSARSARLVPASTARDYSATEAATAAATAAAAAGITAEPRLSSHAPGTQGQPMTIQSLEQLMWLLGPCSASNLFSAEAQPAKVQEVPARGRTPEYVKYAVPEQMQHQFHSVWYQGIEAARFRAEAYECKLSMMLAGMERELRSGGSSSTATAGVVQEERCSSAAGAVQSSTGYTAAAGLSRGFPAQVKLDTCKEVFQHPVSALVVLIRQLLHEAEEAERLVLKAPAANVLDADQHLRCVTTRLKATGALARVVHKVADGTGRSSRFMCMAFGAWRCSGKRSSKSHTEKDMELPLQTHVFIPKQFLQALHCHCTAHPGCILHDMDLVAVIAAVQHVFQ